MSVKESTGNTETMRSLKHYGFGAHKLSDVRGSRFVENKPCDIIAQSPKGRYIAIEGKMMTKLSNFNEAWLRPNQVIALNDCLRRKGRAFVFLYVRVRGDRENGTKAIVKLCVLDWKIHREALKGKGYGVDLIRAQSVGVWLDPTHDEDKKIIWPIKKLLHKDFNHL